MEKKRILLLFAHPRFEQSKTNKALIQAVKNIDGVTFHDLYERYPDFNIDVMIEKDLLTHHDIVIWHHPFYWYSCPPLLKQWIDVVLEYGWAYGQGGNALQGKYSFNTITAGGTREVYASGGRNNYSIPEFLRPFEQTSTLCHMKYLPPFTVMGTHKKDTLNLQGFGEDYKNLLVLMRDHFDSIQFEEVEMLNDLDSLKA